MGEAATMSVVDVVLEMLRSHYPGFEVDLGPRFRSARARRASTEPPPPQEPPRRQTRRRWRRRPSEPPPLAAPPPDPVLVASYDELGLPVGADLKTVQRAWKRLARQHHPDVHVGDPERERRSTERMQRLNSACEEIRRRLLVSSS